MDKILQLLGRRRRWLVCFTYVSEEGVIIKSHTDISTSSHKLTTYMVNDITHSLAKKNNAVRNKIVVQNIIKLESLTCEVL